MKLLIFVLIIFTFLSGCATIEETSEETSKVNITEYIKNTISETFPPKTYQSPIKSIIRKVNMSHPILFDYPPVFNNSPAVFIEDSCPSYMREDIRRGMRYWEIETYYLKFTEVNDKKNANIVVKCKIDPINETIEGGYIYTTLGEGGPVEAYTINDFVIIEKSEMLVTFTTKQCSEPIRVMHEIGHALGFDHSKNESSFMYQYEECNQVFTDELRQAVNKIYGEYAFPDLTITQANARWENNFLNISFWIENIGTRASQRSKVLVHIDNEVIWKDDIEPLLAGWYIDFSELSIFVETPPEKITIAVDPYDSLTEINEKNNFIELF